jgi:hypothetical protein
VSGTCVRTVGHAESGRLPDLPVISASGLLLLVLPALALLHRTVPPAGLFPSRMLSLH